MEEKDERLSGKTILSVVIIGSTLSIAFLFPFLFHIAFPIAFITILWNLYRFISDMSVLSDDNEADGDQEEEKQLIVDLSAKDLERQKSKGEVRCLL